MADTKKQLLYFMIDNPMRDKAGNMTRCLQMLTYLESRAAYFDSEFLSIEPWNEVEKEAFKEKFPSIKLETYYRKYPKSQSYLKYFFADKLPNMIRNLFRSKKRLDNVSSYVIRQIKKKYNAKLFDVLIVSYSDWANIVSYIPAKYTINDTHDFLTAQTFERQDIGYNMLGKIFAEEIKALSKFDEIWTYSIEERFMFDQFLGNKTCLFPISFVNRTDTVQHEKDIDILYVASWNIHNIAGMNWFISKVLPLLGERKVTVIGMICQKIPDHPLIQKIGVVDNLEKYYSRAKITICPMLSGTGIKIKVVESLSYGIPVVTTWRGLDGILNKVGNGILLSENENEFSENILKLLENPESLELHRKQAISFFTRNYQNEQEVQFLDSRLLVR